MVSFGSKACDPQELFVVCSSAQLLASYLSSPCGRSDSAGRPESLIDLVDKCSFKNCSVKTFSGIVRLGKKLEVEVNSWQEE